METALKYNPNSSKAGEFINDDEILETIKWANENAENKALIEKILEKSAFMKGLSHREAALLLACKDPEITEKMKTIARAIKQHFYGNRIVLFAPLYLSNYCINNCVYCPYHRANTTIPRIKLTQDQIRAEVTALQDMGHKRLAIEAGEDPKNNPLEYILESIDTIYSVKHKSGAIRRVNVNIAAESVENYKRLHDAKIGTYILFQETYNKPGYEKLHPGGPKGDYNYHTEAMDRAMQGGIEDVGLGVLFGLENYLYEFIGLIMHAEHLEAAFGVGPHTISVPRVKPADGIDPNTFDGGFPDDIFEKIIALIRITVPYTGMIISTRENARVRKSALELGVSQISGASRTSVGGYVNPERDDSSAQFDVSDQRSLDEVIVWLMEMGYLPSFCTACYREGRVGGNFMKLLKGGHIAKNCQANALMTLSEYLHDYGSDRARTVGSNIMTSELNTITDEKIKSYVADVIAEHKNDKFI
jgi:2-iminoacetate synthase